MFSIKVVLPDAGGPTIIQVQLDSMFWMSNSLILMSSIISSSEDLLNKFLLKEKNKQSLVFQNIDRVYTVTIFLLFVKEEKIMYKL